MTNRRWLFLSAPSALAGILAIGMGSCGSDEEVAALTADDAGADGMCSPAATPDVTTTATDTGTGPLADPVVEGARAMIVEGRDTFRNDTFGDEAFWGGALRVHEAIEGMANGGVGAGVSPTTALSVGLKVDAEMLPAALVAQVEAGMVNLGDPATTLALLKLNAVVGLKGIFNAAGTQLSSIGIQCALCHSTVDDSFAPGIGKRLDGWPNRDLNVGAIINLSPDLTPVATLLGVPEAALRSVLMGWGPGRFDAEVFLDGKATKPGGAAATTLIPPAFGLAGVNLHTWTGWGGVSHWNAFVANLEMHGKGTFFDPRLDDATRFPIAAREKFGHITSNPDLITPKLAALQFYQLALTAPKAPAGSFDAAASGRGKTLFEGAAKCATCHVPPIYTEPGWNMHTPQEIGIDDFQSERSPDRRYRTAPLRGLFTHTKGGFYHDGRFATLMDVVNHYDTVLMLALTNEQKADLVEYLKSL